MVSKSFTTTFSFFHLWLFYSVTIPKLEKFSKFTEWKKENEIGNRRHYSYTICSKMPKKKKLGGWIGQENIQNFEIKCIYFVNKMKNCSISNPAKW